MSLVTKPYTFTAPNTIIASEHNSNFDTIYSDYNGNITTANISASAAIPYSKLSLTTSIRITDIAATLTPFLVPSGGIIMWSGTIATIPTGWYLCNGSNSTPDLRDKFIVGAKEDDTVAKTNITGSLTQTGGAATHTHTVANTGWGIDGGSSTNGTVASASNQGNDFSAVNTANGVTTGSSSSLPTYYALAFIMKS